MRFTFQSAVEATGNGAALAVPVGRTALGLQVSGTFTGTIIPEGTVDGTNWVAVAATPVAGGSAVTSITAAGAWRIDLTGLAAVRARVSAYTDGAITAIGNVRN